MRKPTTIAPALAQKAGNSGEPQPNAWRPCNPKLKTHTEFPSRRVRRGWRTTFRSDIPNLPLQTRTSPRYPAPQPRLIGTEILQTFLGLQLLSCHLHCRVCRWLAGGAAAERLSVTTAFSFRGCLLMVNLSCVWRVVALLFLLLCSSAGRGLGSQVVHGISLCSGFVSAGQPWRTGFLLRLCVTLECLKNRRPYISCCSGPRHH